MKIRINLTGSEKGFHLGTEASTQKMSMSYKEISSPCSNWSNLKADQSVTRDKGRGRDLKEEQK